METERGLGGGLDGSENGEFLGIAENQQLALVLLPRFHDWMGRMDLEVTSVGSANA